MKKFTAGCFTDPFRAAWYYDRSMNSAEFAISFGLCISADRLGSTNAPVQMNSNNIPKI